MKVISFFGSSSSGKTTVIQNLISVLSKEYRIVYIKKIPHGNISMDTEGKDTWKMETAGASVSYGLMPDRTYMMSYRHTEVDEILKNSKAFDFVFIEGFDDNMSGIKFLVIGDENYIKYDHDYIIKANNNSYAGDCISYPRDFAKLISIIATSKEFSGK